MKNVETFYCPFCYKIGRGQDFIRLEGGDICKSCADKFYGDLQEVNRSNFFLDGYEPREIKKFLDSYVIEQDHAKKVLAVAVRNHQKRLIDSVLIGEKVTLSKSNILLIGPTGSGKTFLCKTLARYLDIPFIIVDATKMTEVGYSGEDVEQMIYDLFEISGFDIRKTERGLIYIDEIDKIGQKETWGKDIAGEGVQNALLKIIEGTNVSMPFRYQKHFRGHKAPQIRTDNIMFICGGAFSGIKDILRKRLQKTSLGFGGNIEKSKISLSELYQKIEPQDLTSFGLVPELIGRLPIIAPLHELDKNALYRILVEPKNSLVKEYQYLFEMDEVTLSFEEEALHLIAKIASENSSGARSLRGLMEQILQPLMYEVPSIENIVECLVTRESVETRGEEFIFEYEEEKRSFF